MKPAAPCSGCAALAEQVADLAAKFAALEAGRGPRDDADRALVAAMLPSMLSASFTVSAVLRHSALVDPQLATALLAADISSPSELGHWLARMSGQRIGDVMIQRGPRARGGRRWTLRSVC